jgi:hypothetical protein
LFFAGYGLVYVFVLLVVEEAGAVVFFGEAFEGAVFVLLDSGVDVAGYTCVQGSGGAAYDVGVAGFHDGPFDLWW